MAESVFRHKVQTAGLDHHFRIDSAGTGNWHVGDNPDHRTIRTLRDHGIHQYSRARQVRSQDFEEFDHLFAMDDMNLSDLRRWPDGKAEKVSLILDWDAATKGEFVPDPYYGDQKDFEQVYQLLDRATDEVLVKLSRMHEITRTK
ncbi:MAG: low molecular weight phosphotyrosine protein phosphatase [Armatimonadetes bacterium]|nr:low molecular weight phosphotyrosine protein phosphatase [Armatimonadota bacterium]